MIILARLLRLTMAETVFSVHLPLLEVVEVVDGLQTVDLVAAAAAAQATLTQVD